MRYTRFLVLGIIGLIWLPLLYGFSINGAAPGSAASMTPATCPTGTATAIAACSTSTTCQRKVIQFDNIGTANMYIAPAAPASPCSAASPAPVASTKAGKWIGPGQSWILRADDKLNPNEQAICSEWDMQCDGTGSVGSHIDIP